MSDCKLNIVLDIDETLVYFIHNRFKAHSWDGLSAEEKSKYQTHETKNGIFIIRPHLEEFFDFLFENCTVSLWTWSDDVYAKSIARDFVIGDHPERKLKLILSEDHADESSWKHGNSKDLNWIWYEQNEPCFSECNTILIDDLPSNSVNSSNRQNSITIKPFALFGEVKDRTDPYEDVSKDRCLLDVIDLLKKVIPATKNCYNDESRWDNIFSSANIDRLGLQSYVKNIKLYTKKTKEETIVKGIGIGHSHLFVGGGRKRRQTRRKHTRRRQTRRR